MGTYENLVIRDLLGKKDFGIKEVNDLKSIKFLPYSKSNYLTIQGLIKEKDLEAIKKLQFDLNGVSEYLDIMEFSDQDDNVYIVTVYDSDELNEDPEFIEIFKI